MKAKKKLIEVALPLVAINTASAREKQPGIGAHPRGLHLWWARRPLAAARAVIFAQMVDDPSSHPDLFPTEKAQEKERQRLFRIIENLVLWENTTNEAVLEKARAEIWQSWRAECAENAGHPRAKELFDRHKLPAFHDPFAGGGALPLEAQRLGLESYASDLNPVAVLINKAMIEIPPKFTGRPPVNPASRKDKALIAREWRGAQGLAEDVRDYGQWMRDEAEKRIGHLYPKVEITAEMAKERSDLKPYVGKKLPVLVWLWARTVRCPNPGCSKIMPLVSSLVLAAKADRKKYLDPKINAGSIRFSVSDEPPKGFKEPEKGFKRGMSGIFECAFCGTVTTRDYVAHQATEYGLGLVQTAVVAEGNRTRIYLAPSSSPVPEPLPEPDTTGLNVELSPNPRDVWCRNFGLKTAEDLFTPRQLLAMTTFSDLIQEVRELVKHDAIGSGTPDDGQSLDAGGNGASAYADAVAVYLAFALSRMADYNSSIATWKPSGEQVMQTYKRQALPMTWDFPESNVMGESAICWKNCVKYTADNLVATAGQQRIVVAGHAFQANASQQSTSTGKVVSTDPPYYDNIGYADLSDFFYAWLRRSLKPVFPNLFATLAVPKAEELVALAYRHGGNAQAETFFMDGMTQAMHRLGEQAHPAFPVTIYYAFKQAEAEGIDGTASTGWDTFLDAVIRAGFAISGTWPMRTELTNKVIGLNANMLASSIVLVCRQRAANAATASRREFVSALKAELPEALAHLQRGNIAPVDLAQAAIGPGMAVYTRFAKVLDAGGMALSVREALALINQTLDEALTEQEGDFDADSRWALAWFEQSGFDAGEYGVAETLSKAKNTSVSSMVDAGILASKAGKVRLLRPEELPANWDPKTDPRLTAWESVHQLVRVLEAGGEKAAAGLVEKLGSKAEGARELAYRLYTVCERRKRAHEALSYNGLVQSWPEITRLAREGATIQAAQTEMFNRG
jgi:putative DNA methylase